MDVCLLWVLLGTGLCVWPIPHPEESYRMRCVVVCDLETSRIRRPRPALGRRATRRKKLKCYAMPFSLLFKLPRKLYSDFHARLMYRLICITVRHWFHFQRTFLCAISGYHSGVAEHSDLLRCHALSGKYLSIFFYVFSTVRHSIELFH